MVLGKRRQPDRPADTAVGPINPAIGLRPAHAREALASTAAGGREEWDGRTPDPAHLRRAARLLIGCARIARMGSVRSVVDTTRVLVGAVARRRGNVARAARASVMAAAASESVLTLKAAEAARAARLAAVTTSRDAAPAEQRAVEQAVTTAEFRSLPGGAVADLSPRPPEDLDACRRAAERIVRARVERSESAVIDADRDVEIAAACLLQSVDGGRSVGQSVRDLAHGLVRSAYHAGRDVRTAARNVVLASAHAAREIGIPRAEAAGRAAACAVGAAYAVGDHALRGVWEAVVMRPVVARDDRS